MNNSGGEWERKWRRGKETPQSIFCHQRLQFKRALSPSTPSPPPLLPTYLTEEAQQGRDDDNEDDNDRDVTDW